MVFFDDLQDNNIIKDTKEDVDIEKTEAEPKVSIYEQCEQELNICKDNLGSARDRYQYLMAEFDNYKRRVEKERSQWTTAAQSQVLKDMLLILDDFERALENQEREEMPKEVMAYLQGYELILKSFQKLFSKYEVEVIKQVKEFNPEEHEAVMRVGSKDHDTGDIVQVLEKGYKHKSQVLRPAKVSVAE